MPENPLFPEPPPKPREITFPHDVLTFLYNNLINSVIKDKKVSLQYETVIDIKAVSFSENREALEECLFLARLVLEDVLMRDYPTISQLEQKETKRLYNKLVCHFERLLPLEGSE